MNMVARAHAVANAEWSDLADELDRWEEAGRVATLWWRDDDAVAMTPSLARLVALAGAVPLALAVIPADADGQLAAALRPLANVAVLQHGWRHANHAVVGKKSEFPPERAASLVAADLASGRERLAALFGASALPVLVPPWNRFAPSFEKLLAGAGIAGLSAMAPRRVPPLDPRIAALDVHIDLVAWRGGRGFVGEAAALGLLVSALRERRLGLTDAVAPTGVLTHHLLLDAATADFLARLTALVNAHPAARWVDIRERLR
ncbi:MAG TPA: polysaccharide deacetylase family protein [Stellaceae bacterium]|nr:polysaccharide deacetylase family protein [Stellaceae bacterium]